MKHVEYYGYDKTKNKRWYIWLLPNVEIGEEAFVNVDRNW